MYPIITCCRSYLLVTTLEGSCLIYNISSGSETVPLVLQSKPVERKVDDEAKGIVLCAQFSNTTKYLATCNDYKQIQLYSIDSGSPQDWKLLSTRSTAKKGIKIEFVKGDSHMVVADKFGDVSLFSVDEPEKDGETILGHLSMLLDCTFILEGKYLITGDRDEKIRVSHYPNTFDIQAFCLGHRKYVTSIVAVNDWLVSGSGDGSVKLWEPLTGRLLSEVMCSEDSRVVQQVIYMNQSKSVVCLIAGSTKLVSIPINIDGDNASLESEISEHELSAPAIAICNYLNSVIVLLDCEEHPFDIVNMGGNSSDYIDRKFLTTVSNDISSRWKSFSKACQCQKDFFANLTKMNTDNIEEELTRKGKRIPSTVEKNSSKVAKRSSNSASAMNH